ncbi:MAG: hypothetical protein K9M81_06065 [Chthoniobacterales bacterium]|nr:hypothetical protein [Chthoniobacterales bacterium]
MSIILAISSCLIQAQTQEPEKTSSLYRDIFFCIQYNYDNDKDWPNMKLGGDELSILQPIPNSDSVVLPDITIPLYGLITKDKLCIQASIYNSTITKYNATKTDLFCDFQLISVEESSPGIVEYSNPDEPTHPIFIKKSIGKIELIFEGHVSNKEPSLEANESDLTGSRHFFIHLPVNIVE